MPIGRTMPETIALAEAAVREAEPLAAADPFRPAFHLRAPAQWMNDICGALYHGGYYHVFYQHNPFDDRCDWGRVHSCWGHARSRDLVHWEHLPIAVAPSEAEGNTQCASGCATHTDSGTPILFYGHTPMRRGPDRLPREQWAAVPLDEDLRTWRTLDVGLAPGRSGIPEDIAPSWTDMFVFREGGRAYAIFKEAGGLVVRAEDPALTRWRAVGRIAGVEGECPNLIPCGGRWLLLRSTYPMTYLAGAFDAERIAFTPNAGGVVDYAYGLEAPAPGEAPEGYYLDEGGVWVARRGAPAAYSESRGFYATSAFQDPAGQTLLVGWVGAFRGRGWNGCMSLPRVLSLDATGRLRQRPLPALAALRGPHTALEDVGLGQGEVVAREVVGDMLEVRADLTLGGARRVTLCLADPAAPPGAPAAPAGAPAAVTITWDGATLDANGTLLPRLLTDEPGRLTLHLFYDKSVMELFVNDGLQAVTRVAYPPSQSLSAAVLAEGAGARLNRLDVWGISPIW